MKMILSKVCLHASQPLSRMSQQAFNGVSIFRCFTYLNRVLKSNCTIGAFISDDEGITASLSSVFCGVTNACQKDLPQEVYGGEAVSA